MTLDKRWLLPDGIDELLPERAAAVEQLRRRLLDDCARWGYRYVIPPLVEFTDSLLVGLGADLDLLTCKFVDQLSGRTLGVRADMTMQAARIDAHRLAEEGVTRLCYAGHTLHSTQATVMASRSPIQLGAEIFGCPDIGADLEVIELMLQLLTQAGCHSETAPITLDIGHVGLFDTLMTEARVGPTDRQVVFDALQRKSAPDLEVALATLGDSLAELLRTFSTLHGPPEVIAEARALLGDLPAVGQALDQVAQVVDRVAASHPEVNLYIDLSELRGFRYHTGLVFAAYQAGVGSAIAKGGRYDNVGSAFGRERSATGFACDLTLLAGNAAMASVNEGWIAAPESEDPSLAVAIEALRAEGKTVVRSLSNLPDVRCTEVLENIDNQWVCRSLPNMEST